MRQSDLLNIVFWSIAILTGSTNTNALLITFLFICLLKSHSRRQHQGHIHQRRSTLKEKGTPLYTPWVKGQDTGNVRSFFKPYS